MAGIVLAGGQSRRMGRDKARLPYAGTTLLAHTVETVRAVTGRIIVVAETADRYAVPGTERAGDLYPGIGPLGGIVTGLSAAGPGCHVVVACDMPYLCPDLLRLLLDSVGEYDAAIPEVAGRLQPLCAAYHSRCADRLRTCVEGGEYAVHRTLRTLHARTLCDEEVRRADPDLRSFTNLNTPEDWQRLADCQKGTP